MNSTIKNKKKQLDCGHYDYNFSKGRCKSCAAKGYAPIKKVSDKRWAKEFAEENLQSLIDDLDMVVSQYIRIKYADDKGFVKCYTSNVKIIWRDADCGHFIPRSNLGTRWLEDNLRPQSQYENRINRGNLKVFAEKLEFEKSGIVDYLRTLSLEVAKPTREDLKQLLIEYRHKLQLLKKIKNL